MTAANVHYLIWMAALAVMVTAVAVAWAYKNTHDAANTDPEEDDS